MLKFCFYHGKGLDCMTAFGRAKDVFVLFDWLFAAI